MKDLKEILQEKEVALKRIEKEIDSLCIVISMLDEGQKAELRKPAPIAEPQQTAPTATFKALATEVQSGVDGVACVDGIPPLMAPFRTSAINATQAPLGEARKTSRIWP